MSILDDARDYVAAGISVVPIALDGTKAPEVAWKQFQNRLATDKELVVWFGRKQPAGIATIGGAISGHLEHIDFDRDAQTVFPEWCELVDEESPGLLERLSVACTPGNGYHVRYRCPDEDIPGNMDLALYPSNDPHKKEQRLVIIETRGEGGYALAPGCPAACHETGRLYVHHSGPVIPQAISSVERMVLIHYARSFMRKANEFPKQVGVGDLRPGDDYNLRGDDWSIILEPHGWVCAGTLSSGEKRWRRPGKERGHSATTGRCKAKDGTDLFHPFTNSVDPFEAGKNYCKFRTFAFLNYGGNLSSAADELAKRGFGSRGKAVGPKPSTNGDHKSNGDGPLILWEDPLPFNDDPVAPDFPTDALPLTANRLIVDISWAMNCAPDLAALALLTLAGGAIGNSRHLALTETHRVSACLYAVTVAKPGQTKSPPLALLRRPFNLAETQARLEYKRLMKDWKDQDTDDRGQRPSLTRYQTSNATTESLCPILEENPRGIVTIKNELSGLIAGLNQYKNGAGDDRQFYLDMWDSTPIIVDRKSDRTRDGAPVFILRPFSAIFGTIQPDLLACIRLAAGKRHVSVNDGLLDRFLFSFPAHVAAIRDDCRAVSPELCMAWESAVKELFSLKMQGDPDDLRPVFLHLDSDARHVYQDFTGAIADELNDPSFPEHLHGPWAKLRAYSLRLALILRCLRWAYNQGEGEIDDLNCVESADMAGAVRLIDYFKGHTRKVYGCLETDPLQHDAQRVLAWLGNSVNKNGFLCNSVNREKSANSPGKTHSVNIVNSVNGFPGVSKRDVHAGVLGGQKDVIYTTEVINLLVRHGYLRPLLNIEKDGPGRPPSPRYEVHPSLYLEPHSHNSQYSQNSGNRYKTSENGEAAHDSQNPIKLPGPSQNYFREPGEEG